MSNNKKVNKKLIAWLVILFLGNLLFFFTIWLLRKYDHIYLDQILFQLKSPANGANRSLAGSVVIQVGVYPILLTAAQVFSYLFLGGFIKKFKANERYARYCLSKF